jgi:16S rRNA (adenine1518-N6/adenine1519-N6)-dimethyltransferase
VRDLLDRHEIRPSRARGQHFVVDPNTVRRVARAAGVGPGDWVVEVGAGLGSLTLALAETGASVLALEVDHRLIPVLREVVAGAADVTVVEADAMTADWTALLGDGPWTLVANLPYNVGTPLVADLLHSVPAITRMVVMVQKEVGERLVAGVGDDGYGALSVKIAHWAAARIVGRVPASVFLPSPNVESVLVEITRRPAPEMTDDVNREWLFRLVEAGFAHRRKMLRGSLSGLVSVDDMASAGVRPDARAEELSLEDWARLARWTSRPTPS